MSSLPPSSSSNSLSQHHPLSGIAKTLGTELLHKIQTSKILLVGSGGIGCELLKNLALSGFRHVQVIDLDTIDVSNLNRQFLFRSQHVGQPKCEVACHVVSESMIPPLLYPTEHQQEKDDDAAQYIAHHGNVCDNTKFHVQFVSQFDVVLNALDNVAARRRVNRLCLAAQVPLVEAGTTGYLGQVNVIDKASRVACYECTSKETAKVYPICTIRSTPSMPVHTIVWAKELYKLLFGEKVEDSMLYEAQGSANQNDNGENGNHTTTNGGTNAAKSVASAAITPDKNTEESGVTEPSTYMASIVELRKIIHQTSPSNGNQQQIYQLVRDALVGLYVDEIQKQLQMGRYKAALKTPAPLNMEWIEQGTSVETIPPTRTAKYKSTDVWSPTECIAEFTSCLVQATTPVDNQEPLFLPSFDKDDALAMRFVTAASNLRNHVFDISPIQSLYSAKGIAGNIIPAIATTNAICAGLQVLQVFHILRAQLDHDGAKAGHVAETCRYINCVRTPFRNGLYLSATPLEKPNPKCFVCRNATLALSLTTTHWTLQDLLTKVLKHELGFEQPTLMIEGDMIWEEGEGADSAFYTPNLSKLLPLLPSGGIQHGTVIRVEDFSQELEVDVCFHHVDTWPENVDEDEAARENIRGNDEHLFIVGGDKPIVAATSEVAAATAPATTNGGGTEQNDDDDDIVEVLAEGEVDGKMGSNESGKPRARKRSRESDDGDDAERSKKVANLKEDHDVIEID